MPMSRHGMHKVLSLFRMQFIVMYSRELWLMVYLASQKAILLKVTDDIKTNYVLKSFT